MSNNPGFVSCQDWSSEICIEKCNTFKQQQDIDIICLHLFELWFRLKRAYKVRIANLVASSVGLLTPLPTQYGADGQVIGSEAPFSLQVPAPWVEEVPANRKNKSRFPFWQNIPTWDEFY